jgi:light-harvesting protein B-800-850 alpha chain
MNNGRLWTVVNPSVGLPLFLGGVIVVSLIVHSAILANTDWFAAFWSGGPEAVEAAE